MARHASFNPHVVVGSVRYSWLVLVLASCVAPPSPHPIRRRVMQDLNRPEDKSEQVITGDYPDWLKRNYCQWIRYAYDLEVE